MKSGSHRVLRFLACSLLPILVIGCSSVSLHTMPYVGVSRPAPTDPARVSLLREEPKEAFDRLGEVIVDASVDPAPSVERIESALRNGAAQMGADAVLVVHDRVQPVGAIVQPPWWGPSYSTVLGRVVVGIALRYRASR